MKRDETREFLLRHVDKVLPKHQVLECYSENDGFYYLRLREHSSEINLLLPIELEWIEQCQSSRNHSTCPLERALNQGAKILRFASEESKRPS